MKMIILAAGQGTRLMPLTINKPKCMVEYRKKPIINYILEVAKKCRIDRIGVATGYKKDVLMDHLQGEELSFFTNPHYDKTNMVSTLFSAKSFMDDDLIISYSDIVYKKEVLDSLIDADGDFNVVVDRNWKELWSLRMENPLNDLETLKVKNGNIIELGKKPDSYDDIEGQYIGLIKISKNIINQVKKYYENLEKNTTINKNNFENMYMTSFIQMLIDDFCEVKPVYISGGWIEIDSCEDLRKMEDIDEKFII
jgi:L-glutamine-phosphate cytidylyltransferase